MKGFLKYANPGTDDYPWRILFDSVFFVWVGIVLLNVITGLMVDEFAAIREEAATRAEILDTDCFICGLKRHVYEDMGLDAGSPTFDEHLSQDHDIWIYVAYACYLKKKDETEHNGIESFVTSQMESGSLEWIPSRTSFELERQGKTGPGGANEETGPSKGELETKMETILEEMSVLRKAIDAVSMLQ